MKIWAALLLVMSLNVFASTLSLSKNELKELNRERKDNGFDAISDVDKVDSVIQNDLDMRMQMNVRNLQDKRPLLPAMPVMEKLGAENMDRETLRKNQWRNANEAINQGKSAIPKIAIPVPGQP